MDRRKGTAKILSKTLGWALILVIIGCAGYASRIRGAREAIEYGEYDRAIENLKELASRKDQDELLYLLDLGIAYHAAGRYPDAISTFLLAEKLVGIVDYTSLSQEVASFVANDRLKQYKGENFEKILINTYLAIDYTLSRQWDDALVECRRVNQKIDRMIREGGLPYERNAFAKYLAAVLFEARREYNDAFVDYRQLLKWNVDHAYLAVGVLRMADRLRALQELEEFHKRFGRIDYRLGKNEGEVILLLEQGRSPIKVPYEGFHLIPRFERRFYTSHSAILRVSGREAQSHAFFDIETTAIRELDHKIGLIMAKKVGGFIAKEIIANEVRKKNEALGILTWVALHATDQADLRNWSTLPARLQIARLTLPAGRHAVHLDRVSTGGIKQLATTWENVEVKPGELLFLNFRMTD